LRENIESALTPDKPFGFCGESAVLRLACASIHWGEEPPLTGAAEEQGRRTGEVPRFIEAAAGGSGTIFVSGCNLGCAFCQNFQINRLKNPKAFDHLKSLGRAVGTAEFARICLVLLDRGAENINIVTGSHMVPAIVEGIAAAKTAGLTIPVLWNSSAYELPETLELLADTVDVFLPDLKTLDTTIAGHYFNAPDYPVVATSAIGKMLEMRSLHYKEIKKKEGKNNSPVRLISGVMVRHLVLPGSLPSSRKVLRWFADHAAGRALLSLMFQYTPVGFDIHVKSNRGVCNANSTHSTTGHPWPDIPRRYITQKEYDTVLGWLAEFGIEEGYCQELVPGNTDWLPDFNNPNPFPSNLSVPVWHWKSGFI
jgi:putative pyruvate formate lyase activating enzyme